MDFKLNGGVLMIGSLFWQDDLNLGDEKRKNWRNAHLDMSSVVDVSVPIRYGRFSSSKSYTMVFDSTLPQNNYGQAKVAAFQNQIKNYNELRNEVKELSGVEGPGKDFIKGKKGESVAWCVCGILFNPQTVKDEVKESILEEWLKELQQNEIGYNAFVQNPELYSVSEMGELDIPWQKEIEDLDFFLATSTKPQLRDGLAELTEEEIANHVKNRCYFYPNVAHGIKTYQDEKILRALTQ